MVTAMGKHHQAYLDALSALRTCAERASADPRFGRFAGLMRKRRPEVRSPRTATIGGSTRNTSTVLFGWKADTS
jgi:hypothetical protein